MIRKMAILFLMTLLLMAGCARLAPNMAKLQSQPLNMAKLTMFERMVNSVVVLPGCTGIVLRNDGKDAVILTAAHCTKRFQTKLPDGTETTLPIPVTADLGKEAACPGTLGGISLARDLAIITVEKCALPTVVAQLATAPPKLGDVAYAVGHPAAANYILTKGIISRPATMFGNTRYMLVSAPIIFGNSGGPVFNTRGEVIGVNTNVGVVKVRLGDGSTIPAYVAVPHLGLVVPLDEVKAFLRAGGFADLAK